MCILYTYIYIYMCVYVDKYVAEVREVLDVEFREAR